MRRNERTVERLELVAFINGQCHHRLMKINSCMWSAREEPEKGTTAKWNTNGTVTREVTQGKRYTERGRERHAERVPKMHRVGAIHGKCARANGTGRRKSTCSTHGPVSGEHALTSRGRRHYENATLSVQTKLLRCDRDRDRVTTCTARQVLRLMYLVSYRSNK